MGWHLVLARDGTVLVATDGAPASWVGTRLEDRRDVPDDLKEAIAGLLEGARHSASPVSAAAPLQSMGETISLTVIDVLPIRRKPTNLAALLGSSLDVM